VSRDIVWYLFIGEFCLLHVLADGLSRKGSDCAASAPIIWHCIYSIALEMYGLAMGMLLLSDISLAFCAVRA
jgi:hypothetical protein